MATTSALGGEEKNFERYLEPSYEKTAWGFPVSYENDSEEGI